MVCVVLVSVTWPGMTHDMCSVSVISVSLTHGMCSLSVPWPGLTHGRSVWHMVCVVLV